MEQFENSHSPDSCIDEVLDYEIRTVSPNSKPRPLQLYRLVYEYTQGLA